jgi:hypothetical protein
MAVAMARHRVAEPLDATVTAAEASAALAAEASAARAAEASAAEEM